MSEGAGIRPVTDHDLPGILAILNESIGSSPANFHWEPLRLEELQGDWELCAALYPWFVLAGPPAGTERNAGADAQPEAVLGFARANSFRSKKAYRWTAEVSVYLAETYRGRGFGKQLYRTLLSELRERGFHLAVAGITLPNPGSEALHKGLGFELVGVFQEVGWKLGAWHGVAQWQLRLGEGPGDPRLLL